MALILKDACGEAVQALLSKNPAFKGLAMISCFKFHFFSALADIFAYLEIPPMY